MEWHRVVVWNGLGEYAATKLRKGDHIYVEGTLVSSDRPAPQPFPTAFR